MDDLLIPKVFEDFCPLSPTEALLVTGGDRYADPGTAERDYMHHRLILRVRYAVIDGVVQIEEVRHVVHRGTHLRLGNVCCGDFADYLWFSDQLAVYCAELSNLRGSALEPRLVCSGEQPFCGHFWNAPYKDTLLYSHKSTIWKHTPDGPVQFLELFEGFTEVCHPTFAGPWVYFEALRGKAPEGWQVWRKHAADDRLEQVLVGGANPYVYDCRLFYSRWNKTTALFETAVCDV